jgi:hypothetical protein
MKKFDPQIYPRKFFVLENEKELELFHGREGEHERLEMDLSARGRTWACVEKETGDLGVAVLYNNVWFDTIAHEAVHVADIIFLDLDACFTLEDDETYAYMVGWVAKCIGEALNLKIVKSKKK